MNSVLDGQNFDNIDDFTKALNKERLYQNSITRGGKAWFTYTGLVCGIELGLKTFSCSYPQILRVNGCNYGGAMDLKPKQWVHLIKSSIENQLQNKP